MYNKRVSRERRGSTAGVTNPERFIHEILMIEYVEGTTTNFRLKFSTQILEYETQTPHDCVEIVTKLKYILRMKK